MSQEVISGISSCFQLLFQSQGQVAHVLLTRSPLEYPQAGLSVRLACVKHAASVRPEPGSNSPLNAYKHDHQKRQPMSTTKEKHPNPTPKRSEERARSQSQTRANARKFEKVHNKKTNARAPEPPTTTTAANNPSTQTN